MDGPGSSSKLGVGSCNGVAVVDSTCFRAGGGVDVWDGGRLEVDAVRMLG